MGFTVHVAKVPTVDKDFFPYTHYADEGHAPQIEVVALNGDVALRCEDLFKLKPNIQQNPKNRIDMYMPYETALLVSQAIENVTGQEGFVPINEASSSAPESARKGPQTLPVINRTGKAAFKRATASVAGRALTGSYGTIYIDDEEPAEGHVEMKGPEIHLGIDLRKGRLSEQIDSAAISLVNVPSSELRVKGERNPIKKAMGRIEVILTEIEANKLASTLKLLSAEID